MLLCSIVSSVRSIVKFKQTIIIKKSPVGTFAEVWRSADIVPLHKKGSKHLRESIVRFRLVELHARSGNKLYVIG